MRFERRRGGRLGRYEITVGQLLSFVAAAVGGCLCAGAAFYYFAKSSGMKSLAGMAGSFC